ncbi:hypothetical protein [Nitrosovibrio tenuis]|uniref:Phage-Barnase-EndoU-ColicinE5/D-RelE-like nuclease domain-containing protein n=1 Tax=Nitrosovibrio tenuis TaxID=1233 RepID=A0A1H7NQZ8_9PROT|nr:hypothetical protein [Nitrosovibrio tenuis]SEL25761.1 hypothetical protein SAMN05216387_107102 [Nitrosovibrio tenuis]
MAFTEFAGQLDDEEPGYVEFNGDLDKKEVEGGFIASAKRAAGAGIKGAGQAAADFIPGISKDNALKKYGQSVIDANPTAVNELSDIADKPLKAVTEATGNAASSMGGIVGARVLGQGITALSPFAGPAAPLVAGVGQVVSWLGPAAIAALPSFGGIRDKQILNDPKNEKDAKAIAIATMGAAAVGAIEQAFGPQQWALAAMTKEGRVKLAEKFAATTLPGAMAKGAGKGAAIEGSEELVQNPLEQLASFDNPTTKENIKDTLFGGAMGAIGGGVLGGGVPMIAGKPVTEHSDAVLKYTAARGGERAKAAAQNELDRRATQGVDPEIANAPESTSEAVDRIIATGRDKADEIRSTAPDAIQSNVLDEESDHIGDINKMVQDAPEAQSQATHGAIESLRSFVASGKAPSVNSVLDENGNRIVVAYTNDPKNHVALALTPEEQRAYDAAADKYHWTDSGAVMTEASRDMARAALPAINRVLFNVPDKPTPEPIQTLNAQLNALGEGRKPGVLLTLGEPMPHTLPPGVKAAEVPGRGTLLYRDDATLQAAMNGQMGTALGYGIDEKPAQADQVVTARDKNGTVIQDVATDGNPAVQQAAATVAGPNGSVEVRPVEEAMGERGANSRAPQSGKFGRVFTGFYRNAKDAIKKLIEHREGEAVGALHHKDVGDIDLVWGSEGTAEKNFEDGFGIAKLVAKGRSDLLKDLQSSIDAMDVKTRSKNRVILESKDHRAIVRLDWDGDQKTWLMTAYEKRSGADTTTGTTSDEGRNVTASPAPTPEISLSQETSEGNNGLRPLIESLIKRRAAAKQSGKERGLHNAIARAKEVIDGKRTDAALESKWFRVQATGMKKVDAETAELLRQIGEAVKAKESRADAQPGELAIPDQRKEMAPPQTAASAAKSVPDVTAEVRPVQDVMGGRVLSQAQKKRTA